MLASKPINKLIFIDLETIPQHISFYDMSTLMQELFLKRFKADAEKMIGLMMDDWDIESLNTEEWKPKLEKFYQNRAALCPEFLRIICISVGWIDDKDIPDDPMQIPIGRELTFKHRTFKGHDESKILADFYGALEGVLSKTVNSSHHLVAYNAFMFDIPVLMKRFIINKMKLPAMLDLDGKAPWTLSYIVDPKVSWKGTSFDGSISLALLCEVLGVPTPKSDIDGSQVRDVYYIENDIDRIAKYCLQDIYRLCECYLRMKGMQNVLILRD